MAVALVTGVIVAKQLSTPAKLQASIVLPEPLPLPAFTLQNQAGASVTRDTFRDHWSLVFFGFTHCPDICPATLQILAAAKEELVTQGRNPLPRIALISVDPERDTPALMKTYVDYFGDGNLGISGDLDELRKLTSALGIFFEKQPQNADGYVVDHTAAVLLVNPDGEFFALFGGPHSIDNFVHDLPLLMASR